MSELTLICNKLKKLKLSNLHFEQRLQEVQKEKWSYSTFLDMILSDEIERRESKQLRIRIAKGQLDPLKTLETFDFTFHKELPIPLIKELATCHFIERNENIFLHGPSGTGKPHLANALGHEACRKNWDVLFYRVHELFDWIQRGEGDGSHKRRLTSIIKIPLLILDDFGLQALTIKQQEDLYEVIPTLTVVWIIYSYSVT